MLEHMRLAKMSFDLWGVLTPTSARPPPGSAAEHENTDGSVETNEPEVQKAPESCTKRSISQAELESSFFKVKL